MTRPTRIGRMSPLVSLDTVLDSGDYASGQVPTATGSNGDVAWASNVALITSNTSNALAGPFVNFSSGTGIAFAAASNTLTISSTVTGGGGDTFGDLGWYNVEDYGAVHDGVTDDSTSIQATIDACVTAGGGTIYFPNGRYYIGATLVDTGTYNSLLKIPQVNSPDFVVIRFLGDESRLVTDWAGAISGTPSMLSAGTHDSHTLNNVAVRFERIGFEAPLNPKLTAIDMTKAVTVRWNGLLITTPSWPASVPTNTNAIGLDMPWGYNDQNSGGEDIYIVGFHTGIRPSEQTVASAVYVAFAAIAAIFRGSGGSPDWLAHACSIQRFNAWFCVRALQFTGDERSVHIGLLDSEHDDPDFVTVYDIDDPSNYGRGYIGWHVSNYATGEPDDDLLVNGGTGLTLFGDHAKRWRLTNVVEIPTGTDPSVNPPSGFSLYAASATGKPTTRSSGGTVTTVMREGDSAGGDLSGTYPNPSVTDDSHSHTAATLPASTGGIGEILITDTPAGTPLVFADLIQNEAQDDLVYADP